VPLTKDEIQAIADKVVHDLLTADCNQAAGGSTLTTGVGAALLKAARAGECITEVTTDLDKLSFTVDTVHSSVDKLSVSGVDVDKLAALLAPKLQPTLREAITAALRQGSL
jgi:hypothetical protein